MPQTRTRNCRWLLPALLFVLTTTAVAVPAADYQKNLQRAITALDTLSQVDEDETDAAYEHRLQETVEAVRSALPEQETVEASDEVCNVDNSWLHAALKELKESPSDKRQIRLADIIARLKAIEERVAYEQRLASPDETKAQTKQKLESILSRPEYVSEMRGPNALARLIQDFINWIQQFLPKPIRLKGGRANWVGTVAQIVVVIVALAVLFYVVKILLIRFKGDRRRRAPKKRTARIVLGERLEPEETATDLLSEAEALARRGELRTAIRKAYIALLVELGDRKLITLAQHKTNHDYLNSVRNVPLLHSRMRGLTDSFERHWYGFVDATENDWQDFRAGYRAALQTGN